MMKLLLAFVLKWHAALRIKRIAVSSFAILFIALHAGNTPANTCFDDNNLQHLKANQERGTLIYVWSPRMVYSVQNVTLAARAAAAGGLGLVVLHDMRVAAGEPPLALQSLHTHPDDVGKRNSTSTVQPDRFHVNADVDWATPPLVSPLDASRPLCAHQLIERDALRHFPTAFVIHHNGIAEHAIVGAMPLSAWESSIAQRLSALLPSVR